SALRYEQEELSKGAQVKVTQRDISAAWTTLKMHEIRASIGGVVKVMYKNRGDAVKSLEAVLQIQDPGVLRVEGLVDVQDAVPLPQRLAQARRLAEQAKGEPLKAAALRAQARKLLEVQVEASRPEPPLAVLKGHLHEVTSVAVGTWRGPKGKEAPRPV